MTKISQTEEENKFRTEEVSLRDIILKANDWSRYLKSWKYLIISFFIAGGGIGLAYALVKKPVFTASTNFVLEEKSSGGGGLGQYSGLASMVGINLGSDGGGLFQEENIFEIYRSRNMIKKTLFSKVNYKGKDVVLLDRYIEMNGLLKKWQDNPRLLKLINSKEDTDKYLNSKINGDSQRLLDSIISVVVADINKYYLKVEKPDTKLSIIKVSVKSTDEFFAKNFNDQVVKNVNDFYIQTKTKRSVENLAILQHQTDSVKNVLNGYIYQTAAVTDATPNLNPTRQILRTGAQRSQFNAEANKAIYGQLVQNLELAKLSLRQEKPLIQVIDIPTYPIEVVKPSKIIYSLLGAFFAVFILISILTLRRLYKNLLIA